MSKTFTRRRRVEFRDTDMARIVHFSVFFAYMEETEHELLRSLGLGVICDVDGQTVSFPRVNAQCDYRSAIRFEEEVDIELSIARIGTKSITWNYRFTREDTHVADGSITTVCCIMDHHSREPKRPEPVAIPDEIVEKLKPYLAAPAAE